jgi:hypothetical protein
MDRRRHRGGSRHLVDVSAGRSLDRRLSAADRRGTELVERADQQHAWTMCGDDRGIYGDYIPKQFD